MYMTVLPACMSGLYVHACMVGITGGFSRASKGLCCTPGQCLTFPVHADSRTAGRGKLP